MKAIGKLPASATVLGIATMATFLVISTDHGVFVHDITKPNSGLKKLEPVHAR